MSKRTTPVVLAVRAAGALAAVGVVAGGVMLGGLAGGKASADDVDYFSTDRLMADCDGTALLPNGKGTSYAGYLDGCHYEESSSKDYWRWQDGDVNGQLTPINNCAQPKDAPAATETYTYTHTTTTTWSIGLNGSANVVKGDSTLGSVGIDASYGQSVANAVGKSETMSVPGQRKGTWAIGQKMHHSEGRIRVNYSTPVGPSDDDEHYIWYINHIKIDTPYTSDNVEELSGGEQSKGTVVTQMAPDVVKCDAKLLGELNPPTKDTDGSNPPTDTQLTTTKLTRKSVGSRPVAP